MNLPNNYTYSPNNNENASFTFKNAFLLFTTGFKKTFTSSTLIGVILATLLTLGFGALGVVSINYTLLIPVSVFVAIGYTLSLFTLGHYAYKAEGLANSYFVKFKKYFPTIVFVAVLISFLFLSAQYVTYLWANTYQELSNGRNLTIIEVIKLPFTEFSMSAFWASLYSFTKYAVIPPLYAFLSYFLLLHSQVLMIAINNPDAKDDLPFMKLNGLIFAKVRKMNKAILVSILFGGITLVLVYYFLLVPVVQQVVANNVSYLQTQSESYLAKEDTEHAKAVAKAAVDTITYIIYTAITFMTVVFYYLLKVKMRSILLLYVITENYEDYVDRLTEPTEDMFIAPENVKEPERQITYQEWRNKTS